MSNDLIRVDRGSVMAYLRGKHEKVEVPRPYESVTLLVNTYLSCFDVDLAERARKAEENNEKLELRCKQGDAESCDSVTVTCSDGTKLGCIPQHEASILFRLLSCGKTLYAMIAATESRGGHPKAKIAVYMQD